ncbi:MAG: ceramidase domain-containing protein [Chitinophagales bacterium]|nr:ceramidase domain-containing protein [Chitinophagales bacterium]
MPILDFEKFKDNFSMSIHRPRVFTQPIFIGLLFFGILFVFYKLNQYISPWENYKQAGGNATDFCEMNRFDQLIVQPSNTWSNILFIIVAFIIISIAKNDHKYFERSSINNLVARYPGFSFLLGCSTLYLGLGSFLYHGTLTHFFQKVDQTGMYFVLISAIAYNMFKIFPKIRWKKTLRSSHKFILVCALVLMLAFYLYLWKMPINIVFPILVLSYFGSNYFIYKKLNHSKPVTAFIKASFFTLLLSFSLWILDITSVLCSPTSVFQGHALWHILNAIAIFLMYLYVRSEEYLPEEVATE